MRLRLRRWLLLPPRLWPARRRIRSRQPPVRNHEEALARASTNTAVATPKASGRTTSGPAPAAAPTNAKVIAMVKDGIDENTVAQAVRNAKAVDFDLSSADSGGWRRQESRRPC